MIDDYLGESDTSSEEGDLEELDYLNDNLPKDYAVDEAKYEFDPELLGDGEV